MLKLSEAVRGASADTVIAELRDGRRSAVGREGGEGLPKPIPAEHFLISATPPPPPMIAVSEAIRGDITLYAGGVTTADVEYDELLRDVLRGPRDDTPWLDVADNAIRSEAGYYWTDIQVSALDQARPKALPGSGKRGPKPKKFVEVQNAMRAMTRVELDAMTEKEMEHAFGASRTTCRDARKQLRQSATNDK